MNSSSQNSELSKQKSKQSQWHVQQNFGQQSQSESSMDQSEFNMSENNQAQSKKAIHLLHDHSQLQLEDQEYQNKNLKSISNKQLSDSLQQSGLDQSKDINKTKYQNSIILNAVVPKQNISAIQDPWLEGINENESNEMSVNNSEEKMISEDFTMMFNEKIYRQARSIQQSFHNSTEGLQEIHNAVQIDPAHQNSRILNVDSSIEQKPSFNAESQIFQKASTSSEMSSIIKSSSNPQQKKTDKSIKARDKLKMLKEFQSQQLQVIKKIQQDKSQIVDIFQDLTKQQQQLYTQNKKIFWQQLYGLQLLFKTVQVKDFISCKWQNIIYLKLCYCGISDSGWNDLVKNIHNFKLVKLINITDNYIRNVSKLDIINISLRLELLKIIYFQSNPLSKKSLNILHEVKTKIQIFPKKEDTQDQSFKIMYVKRWIRFQSQNVQFIKQWILSEQNNKIWLYLIENLKIFQLMRYVDFRGQQIQNIKCYELQRLHQKTKTVKQEKKITIDVSNNPLSEKSLSQIQLFYKNNKNSKLCIITKNLSIQYHQQRINFIESGERISFHINRIYCLIEKGFEKQIIQEQKQNLMETIEIQKLKYKEKIDYTYLNELFYSVERKYTYKNLFTDNKQYFHKILNQFYQYKQCVLKHFRPNQPQISMNIPGMQLFTKKVNPFSNS